jgi:hypothetical protein
VVEPTIAPDAVAMSTSSRASSPHVSGSAVVNPVPVVIDAAVKMPSKTVPGAALPWALRASMMPIATTKITNARSSVAWTPRPRRVMSRHHST